MAETPKPKASFKALNTRMLSNEGIKLILKDTEDKPMEHWVRILGIDSDVFQRANRKMRAEVLTYLEKNGMASKETVEYVDFTIIQQRKLQAALVIDWSFDEPCTPENVLTMLTDAPYIATQIDESASKRSQFVKV